MHTTLQPQRQQWRHNITNNIHTKHRPQTGMAPVCGEAQAQEVGNMGWPAATLGNARGRRRAAVGAQTVRQC